MNANLHRIAVRFGWAVLQHLQLHPHWWTKVWVYPERIGTPTSFSRYSWDTSPGCSSWSFTQGLDRSVVRATCDLEFCRLSQVFSLWNRQLWREIANGKFYGANPHFDVSIRSAWMSFLECTEDPAKVIHLLTREIPFPALQKKKKYPLLKIQLPSKYSWHHHPGTACSPKTRTV